VSKYIGCRSKSVSFGRIPLLETYALLIVVKIYSDVWYSRELLSICDLSTTMPTYLVS